MKARHAWGMTSLCLYIAVVVELGEPVGQRAFLPLLFYSSDINSRLHANYLLVIGTITQAAEGECCVDVYFEATQQSWIVILFNSFVRLKTAKQGQVQPITKKYSWRKIIYKWRKRLRNKITSKNQIKRTRSNILNETRKE